MCQILGGNHLVTSYHSVYIFEKYEIPRAEKHGENVTI